MRQIKYLMWLVWFGPILLLLSPLHDFAHVANPWYVALIAVAVLSIASGIRNRQVQLTHSALQNRYIIYVNLVFVAILFCGTIVTLYSVMSRWGGLAANRELFESEHRLYSYLFSITVFSAFTLAMSPFVPTLYRSFARLTWLMCGVLLLLTGNRQLVFFSLIYLTVYVLGISRSPGRLFRRVLLGGSMVVILAIVFSIMRLDYIEAEDLGTYGSYMSLLTGATCEGSDLCDTWLEAVYQLLYAYTGMNYTGLTYSIDFFYSNGGFPFASTSFPVLYRRLESAGMVEGLQRYVVDYDRFIARASGGDFSNFFSSMWGAVAIESGFVGLLLVTAALALIVRLLSNRVTRVGNETVYVPFVFVCAGMIFGLMQFPFTEPFLFFALVNMLVHCVIMIAATDNGGPGSSKASAHAGVAKANVQCGTGGPAARRLDGVP